SALHPKQWRYDAALKTTPSPHAWITRMADVEYTIRRKIFTIAGAKFHIYDGADNLIGFSKQKAFKLKEDIRVYRDESMQQEFLAIKARSVIDFSAAYDVVEPNSGRRLGVFKRAGLTS